MAARKTMDAEDRAIKKGLDAEEKVHLHLFKDSERYADDLVVGINGCIYQIKRGEDVMVPKSVYEVVMNSMKQDEIAAAQMVEMQSKLNDTALA